LINVSRSENLDETLVVLTITKTILKLFNTDEAISIAVECHEDALELTDLAWVELNGDCHHGNLLDLLGLAKLLEVGKVEFLHSFSKFGLLTFSVMRSDPRMRKSLCSSKSSVRLAEKLSDKVFAVLTYCVPLLSFEVECTFSDSSKDLLVGLTKEWGIATKQNVKNASS